MCIRDRSTIYHSPSNIIIIILNIIIAAGAAVVVVAGSVGRVKPLSQRHQCAFVRLYDIIAYHLTSQNGPIHLRIYVILW